MRFGTSGQHWLSSSARDDGWDDQQQRFASGEVDQIGMTAIGALPSLGNDNRAARFDSYESFLAAPADGRAGVFLFRCQIAARYVVSVDCVA
jgi:hypothetical protein